MPEPLFTVNNLTKVYQRSFSDVVARKQKWGVDVRRYITWKHECRDVLMKELNLGAQLFSEQILRYVVIGFAMIVLVLTTMVQPILEYRDMKRQAEPQGLKYRVVMLAIKALMFMVQIVFMIQRHLKDRNFRFILDKECSDEIENR